MNEDTEYYNFGNVHDTLERGIPKIEYVINPLLRKGGTLFIAGEPASRKSLLAQYISICIIKGKPIFDKFEVQKGKVLWVDFENGFIVLLNRYNDLLYGDFTGNMSGMENCFYSISPAFKLDDKDTISMLYALIEKTGVDVCIIDPLIGAISGDENKSQDMRKVRDYIAPLMEQGISFIIIHHIGKDADKRGLNAMRGSSDLGGMAEVVLLAIKNGEFTNIKLEKHRHLGPEAFEPFGFMVSKPFGEESKPIKLVYSEFDPQQLDAVSKCVDDSTQWIDNSFKSGEHFKTGALVKEMGRFGGHSNYAVYEAIKRLTSQKIIKLTKKKGEYEVL